MVVTASHYSFRVRGTVRVRVSGGGGGAAERSYNCNFRTLFESVTRRLFVTCGRNIGAMIMANRSMLN